MAVDVPVPTDVSKVFPVAIVIAGRGAVEVAIPRPGSDVVVVVVSIGASGAVEVSNTKAGPGGAVIVVSKCASGVLRDPFSVSLGVPGEAAIAVRPDVVAVVTSTCGSALDVTTITSCPEVVAVEVSVGGVRIVQVGVTTVGSGVDVMVPMGDENVVEPVVIMYCPGVEGTLSTCVAEDAETITTAGSGITGDAMGTENPRDVGVGGIVAGSEMSGVATSGDAMSFLAMVGEVVASSSGYGVGVVFRGGSGDDGVPRGDEISLLAGVTCPLLIGVCDIAKPEIAAGAG